MDKIDAPVKLTQPDEIKAFLESKCSGLGKMFTMGVGHILSERVRKFDEKTALKVAMILTDSPEAAKVVTPQVSEDTLLYFTMVALDEASYASDVLALWFIDIVNGEITDKMSPVPAPSTLQ